MSIEFIARAKLPTDFGEFDVHAFLHNGQEHLALIMGDFTNGDTVLSRVHSECLTGDSLFSLRCDCGPQLAFAMNAIKDKGQGLLIYLRQEGRGIGLVEKIKAYNLQDQGDDTYEANVKLGHPADNRSYNMLGDVYKHFGVSTIDLMTNNPEKISAIESAGIEIVTRIPIQAGHNPHNEDYLQTKKVKFKHL